MNKLFKYSLALMLFVTACSITATAQTDSSDKNKVPTAAGNLPQEVESSTPPYSDEKWEDVMNAVVVGMNKNCPIKLDEVTTLTHAKNLGSKSFGYYYALDINEDEVNVDLLKGVMEKQVLQTVKTNKLMKVARDMSCTFIYIYSNTEDKELFTITITPEMYKEK